MCQPIADGFACFEESHRESLFSPLHTHMSTKTIRHSTFLFNFSAMARSIEKPLSYRIKMLSAVHESLQQCDEKKMAKYRPNKK